MKTLVNFIGQKQVEHGPLFLRKTFLLIVKDGSAIVSLNLESFFMHLLDPPSDDSSSSSSSSSSLSSSSSSSSSSSESEAESDFERFEDLDFGGAIGRVGRAIGFRNGKTIKIK